MSTLVMVEKAGVAAMAADTLTSFGSRKESARYVARPEKILEVGPSYIGLVGFSAHTSVLESALANGLKVPQFADERELFEFSRALHKVLKRDYFLNPCEERELPYESSQMSLFVINRHGMFRLCSLREADRCLRFAAEGSGQPYALGAMHAAYDQDLSAEEIARAGVSAGIEFDDASLGPITVKSLKTEREQVNAPVSETMMVWS